MYSSCSCVFSFLVQCTWSISAFSILSIPHHQYVDEVGIDEVGIDEVGIDEVGIDGIDKMSVNDDFRLSANATSN